MRLSERPADAFRAAATKTARVAINWGGLGPGSDCLRAGNPLGYFYGSVREVNEGFRGKVPLLGPLSGTGLNWNRYFFSGRGPCSRKAKSEHRLQPEINT